MAISFSNCMICSGVFPSLSFSVSSDFLLLWANGIAFLASSFIARLAVAFVAALGIFAIRIFVAIVVLVAALVVVAAGRARSVVSFFALAAIRLSCCRHVQIDAVGIVGTHVLSAAFVCVAAYDITGRGNLRICSGRAKTLEAARKIDAFHSVRAADSLALVDVRAAVVGVGGVSFETDADSLSIVSEDAHLSSATAWLANCHVFFASDDL